MLIFPLISSLTIAIVPSGLGIDVRKIVGHVTAHISCSGIERDTSISIGGMQSQEDIHKFLKRYKSSVKYFSMPVSERECAELLKFDDFYHDLSKVYFSPFLDPLLEYKNHERGLPASFGGTGASYAKGLLQIARVKLNYESCKENILGKKVETAKGMLNCLTKISAQNQ